MFAINIDSRADVAVINSSGQTALEIAKFWKHGDVVELLAGEKNHGEQSLYTVCS